MKNLEQNTNKRNEQAHRDYRHIDQEICNSLMDALILFKMKTGNKGNYGNSPLYFNDNWEIVNNKKDDEKWPVDVIGHIENINIFNIQKDIYTLLETQNVPSEDKDKFLTATNNFINKNFKQQRKNLEKKKKNDKNPIHKKFRSFYTKEAHLMAQKIDSHGPSEKSDKLYRDILLSLANMLYERNPHFLDESWEINKKGLEYIAKVFLNTIKNIDNSWSSKSVHKIFHDGDFCFLRNEKEDGSIEAWLLEHYVQTLCYLLDSNGFNAYEEGGYEGKSEWYRWKKAFLNTLLANMEVENGEKKSNGLSYENDKIAAHHYTASLWGKCLEEVETNILWKSSDRSKSRGSLAQKMGGRTSDIRDESWVRVTHYISKTPENKDEVQKNTEHDIKKIIENYIEKLQLTPWIAIEEILISRKGDFTSAAGAKSITQTLMDVNKTEKIEERHKAASDYGIEMVKTKYKKFTKKAPSPWMLQAFKITKWSVKRGGNGAFEDFKVNLRLKITPNKNNGLKEETQMWQEVSFYSFENDLSMGNHNILDLEKRIFGRVKNMDDMDLGKSISLNRLRYFTEQSIKSLSFYVDKMEHAIATGETPDPWNDNYKSFVINGNKYPLKNLLYRNKENSQIFDNLITDIINYFIQSNKLIYINTPGTSHYGLINKDMLHTKYDYKNKRFTTSDELKSTATNIRHKDDSICFYTPNTTRSHNNFFEVKVQDLSDLMGLHKRG